MPELTIEQLTFALAVVAALALLAVLLSLILMARLRKVRREYRRFQREDGDSDIMGALRRASEDVEEVHRRVERLERSQEDVAMMGRLGLQRFGLVRYDAFEDMGGQLSFSAALLDDYGDGIVITSINGRSETRSYAKPVKSMKSNHNLSEEEVEALSQAASGEGRAEAEPARSSSR